MTAKKRKGAAVQIPGNRRIYGLLFLFLMLFAFAYADDETESFSYTPEVKAVVSDREIIAGHFIQLKLRAIGDKVSFPKIEKIDGVKVLEKHERITNKFHYINGVLKKERTTLVLTLAPYHDITIPSYEVEIDGRVYHTKPIKVRVAKASARNIEDSNRYVLHLRADKKSVIVGEPIVVHVYFSLKFGVRLADIPQYNKPAFKEFFTKEIGESKVYNEGNREITEHTYLLTPLYEGNYTLGPATAKIVLAGKNKRDMFGSSDTTRVPIASNTSDIEVKEKPRESDLVGSFTIKNSLDRQKAEADKPVSLEVEIKGEGSLEDFEFPDYEISGVTVYSDEAETSVDVNGSLVRSTYRKKFVFVSDHSFTIPARHFSTYDTKSKTVKYLDLPSYDIEIEASSVPAVQKPHTKIPDVGKTQAVPKLSRKSMLDLDEEEEKVLQKAPSAPWWMIALAFVLGMFAMFLLMLLPKMTRRRGSKNYTESKALKILYPHSGESREIEAMVGKLYAKKNGDKSVIIDRKALQEIVKRIEQSG